MAKVSAHLPKSRIFSQHFYQYVKIQLNQAGMQFEQLIEIVGQQGHVLVHRVKQLDTVD